MGTAQYPPQMPRHPLRYDGFNPVKGCQCGACVEAAAEGVPWRPVPACAICAAPHRVELCPNLEAAGAAWRQNRDHGAEILQRLRAALDEAAEDLLHNRVGL